jgi:hypothetical protein
MIEIRRRAISWSESDIKNADTVMTVCQNLQKRWMVWSALAKGALGPDFYYALPQYAIAAWIEADLFATIDPTNVPDDMIRQYNLENMSEEQIAQFVLGYYGGVRLRLGGSMTYEIIKRYAPSIVKLGKEFLL